MARADSKYELEARLHTNGPAIFTGASRSGFEGMSYNNRGVGSAALPSQKYDNQLLSNADSRKWLHTTQKETIWNGLTRPTPRLPSNLAGGEILLPQAAPRQAVDQRGGLVETWIAQGMADHHRPPHFTLGLDNSNRAENRLTGNMIRSP